MMALTEQQLRDAVMLRGLNRDYGEIASYLNDQYGLDVSDSTVGRYIRELEDRSRGTETPQEVFNEVVLHGYLADLL